MDIKLLPKSLRGNLRSGINIKSINHCICQLVLNSLDAQSTIISIRINLITSEIQVIDNGIGISKKNLNLLGCRYATSKYFSTEDLKKHHNIFGCKGETLASIIEVSKKVSIVTRGKTRTYSKTFENGNFSSNIFANNRPSRGTTITIEDFMYNMPVRQKIIKNQNVLDELKKEIELIALIHSQTAFSIRNNSTGEIIFQTYKHQFVYQTASDFYGKEFAKKLRKIYHTERNLTISGLISIETHAQNKIQIIYLNKRYLKRTEIHTIIINLMMKSKIFQNQVSLRHKHLAYIINITCLNSEFYITNYTDFQVEFKNWNNIVNIVTNGISRFLTKNQLNLSPKKQTQNLQIGKIVETKNVFGASQVPGVIKGLPIKRKLEDKTEHSTLNTEPLIPGNYSIDNQLNIEPLIHDNHSINNQVQIDNFDLNNTSETPTKSLTLKKHKINELYLEPTIHSKFLKLNEETLNKHQDNNSSDEGKKLILTMFLKSTALYHELDSSESEFASEANYKNRSICMYMSDNTTYSVSTNIRINYNIREPEIPPTAQNKPSNTFEFNFKQPAIPEFKKPNNINTKLSKNKKIPNTPNNTNLRKKHIIKTISSESTSSHQSLTSFRTRNYKCIIKKRVSRKIKSSDFKQPATNIEINSKHSNRKNHKFLPQSSNFTKTKFKHKQSNYNYFQSSSSWDSCQNRNCRFQNRQNCFSNRKKRIDNKNKCPNSKFKIRSPKFQELSPNNYQFTVPSSSALEMPYESSTITEKSILSSIHRPKQQFDFNLNKLRNKLLPKVEVAEYILNSLRKDMRIYKNLFYTNDDEKYLNAPSNRTDENNKFILKKTKNNHFVDSLRNKKTSTPKHNFFESSSYTENILSSEQENNIFECPENILYTHQINTKQTISVNNDISSDSEETENVPSKKRRDNEFIPFNTNTKKQNIPPTLFNLQNSDKTTNIYSSTKQSYPETTSGDDIISNSVESDFNLFCTNRNLEQLFPKPVNIDKNKSISKNLNQNQTVRDETNNLIKNKNITQTDPYISPKLIEFPEEIINNNFIEIVELSPNNTSCEILSDLRTPTEKINSSKNKENLMLYETSNSKFVTIGINTSPISSTCLRVYKINSSQENKSNSSSSLNTLNSQFKRPKDRGNINKTTENNSITQLYYVPVSNSGINSNNLDLSVIKNATIPTTQIVSHENNTILSENEREIIDDFCIANTSVIDLQEPDNNSVINTEVIASNQNENKIFSSNPSENDSPLNISDIILGLEDSENLTNKKPIETDSEWNKETSLSGNTYYFNYRTGMTSFVSPKCPEQFAMTKRYDFMPKGMSQVLVPTSTVTSKKLSQISKENLYDTITNMEEDLRKVKWLNYFQTKDSDTFFAELYENNKHFESTIPNITKKSYSKKILNSLHHLTIQTDSINQLEFINQWDDKFLITKHNFDKNTEYLVLFDQHAVHERIRLENILKDNQYFLENTSATLKTALLNTSVVLNLSHSEVQMLKNYKTYFENWGCFYKIIDSTKVVFTHIPTCWKSKDDSNDSSGNSCIKLLIESLIHEESNLLRNIGNINITLPVFIRDTMKMEACRGAIKFGDSLTKEQCTDLLKELSQCKLPFQCAHGRPTLFPIYINLKDTIEPKKVLKVNLGKLKKQKITGVSFLLK